MSATTIGWIISIAFIVILIIGFFVGFWRGLKKSTANLVFSIIASLIAFFVTPTISGAVLNIQIESNGQQVSLSQYIIDSLTQDENMAVIIERNPNIQTLIEGLPSAIANVLVFLVVTCAIQLIIYIIYRIIACFTFKTKVGERKHRLFGGLVGLAKVFILTIFAFMPLAGLTGMYNSLQSSNTSFLVQTDSENLVQDEEIVIDESDTASETTSETTEENPMDESSDQIADEVQSDETKIPTDSLLNGIVPQEVNDILSGLENNMLIKICGIFGLDNSMFDYYSKVQVESNTVYIRQEIENLYPVANFAYQVSNSNSSEFNFIDIDYDKLEEYVNNFVDGGLFKSIIVNLANDIIQNYQQYPFISNNQDFTVIKDIILPIQTSLQEYSQNHEMLENYFSHDVKELFATIKTLGQSGLLDKIINTNSDGILDLLFADENISTTESALINILELNMARDAITPITEYALSKVGNQFDEIGVDTSTWNENDWKSLGTSIVNIANDYINLAQQVDIMEIINEPTLLVTDQNIDLNTVTNAIGDIIDEALSIKLLYTSDGQSILASLLEENNITLPNEAVYDADGVEVTIESYSDLFAFVTPALITVKENNLYQILNTSDTKIMLSDLAGLLSQEGKHDILSQIILPLYQVEPTKTFMVDELLSTVDTELVSFVNLASYEDWKNDLGYITDLLITVNEATNSDGTSYLDLVLDGNLDAILNDVSEDEFTSILRPVLYAKSTQGIKDDMFNILTEVADGLTSTPNQIDVSTVTLIEGNSEDQTEEICQVFASFIELNKIYNDNITIKDLDKTTLARFLTNVQTNAYRAILNNKTEQGLFNNMFINLMDTIKITYQDLIEQSEDLQIMLDESNYVNIDFTELFNLIEEIESYL